MVLTHIAKDLERDFGPDPQQVGMKDGTEDDWGDLVSEAANRLGYDPEQMEDEDWHHFQDVAASCNSTDMESWLAHLDAITKEAAWGTER